MCEALLAAGFRPTVYPEVEFEARSPGFDRDFIDRHEPLLACTRCDSVHIRTRSMHAQWHARQRAISVLGRPQGLRSRVQRRLRVCH